MCCGGSFINLATKKIRGAGLGEDSRDATIQWKGHCYTEESVPQSICMDLVGERGTGASVYNHSRLLEGSFWQDNLPIKSCNYVVSFVITLAGGIFDQKPWHHVLSVLTFFL